MPLYEYECEACGHRFEQIQKFSDPPVDVCPKCGEPKVRKLVSSPAIQFKGSGWYITDYARKGGDSSESKGAKDEAKGQEPKASKDSSDTKSTTTESKESKPATDTASTTPSTKSS